MYKLAHCFSPITKLTLRVVLCFVPLRWVFRYCFDRDGIILGGTEEGYPRVCHASKPLLLRNCTGNRIQEFVVKRTFICVLADTDRLKISGKMNL